MSRKISRFVSQLFVFVTTLSVAAAPLARRALPVNYDLPGVSTPAVRSDASGTTQMCPLMRPKLPASGKNIFSSPFNAAGLRVKAPGKVSSQTMAETTQLPDLVGSVVYSETLSSNGLYTIPTNSSQEFKRLFRYANAEFGGVLVDDMYYTCEYYQSPWTGSTIYYTGYNMENGHEDFEVYGSYYTYSMTYDATTSTVYAIANIEGYFALTKITFDTEQQRVIFDPVHAIELNVYGMWNAIACDSKGQLWAVYSNFVEPENENDPVVCTGSTLYRLDKNTGSVTEVGDMGYDSLYASDAVFDTKTDRLFWTVLNTAMEGFLTEVNTSTGEATVIYNFPGHEEVTGLAIPAPEAEDGAPAAVTDVKANFNGGSLSGTVEFKAPATFFDGTEGSGDINYTVSANGAQVATGVTTFGAEVAAQVTVPSAGFYTFVVYVSNEAGEGPKTEVTSFVGSDTPAATTVTADYDNGVVTVSWLPVTSSVNGGYIDIDRVTYTVTRCPGNTVVADKITATTFSETLPEPSQLTTYYYEVVVNAGDLSSSAARSNTVTLGYVVPPFTATFDDSLDGFKVVDSNGDGISWIAWEGSALIKPNYSLDMDDWLISPALKLEAGRLYDIAAEFACVDSDYPERVEVKIGRSAKPGEMTSVLLAPTDVAMEIDAPMEWSSAFVAETDGDYYVGIHGISDMHRIYLYVDNFTVSAPQAPDCPGPVTDLTVKAALNGVLSAEVSFTTPAKTLAGKDLTTLSKVVLSRGSKVIKTWAVPAVNTTLTYTDDLPVAGDYTYTVTAYGTSGEGPATAASVYVGIEYPTVVTGVDAFETDTPGEVTVTWDAVTTTESGAPIDPSLVKYQVFKINEYGSPVAVSGVIDATTFTYQAVASGKQEFVQYAMAAVTDRGAGKITNSSLSAHFPAGTPYKGMTLSNESDLNKYIIGVNNAGGGNWATYDDVLITSQDGDNRMLAMFGPFENSYGDLYTGLISLEGFTNPGLTFYTYNIGNIEGGVPDINEITVSVKEKGAKEFVDAETIVVSETGPGNTWNRVVVDLSAYAGKVIQLNFYSIVKAATYTIIDNIRVGTVYANDLSVTSVSAPSKVTTGDNYMVDVTVTNEGTAVAENYTVELYAGTELVAAKTGEALAGGLSTVVGFDLTMSALATRNIVYSAKVALPGDENSTNNKGKNTVTVTPVASKLPGVGDLAGSADRNAVKLIWNEPDLASIPADAVTEDFEDGLSFSSRFGEWTFVDRDGSPVSGFSDVEVPNIVAGVTKGSFWIWDTDKRGSGDRYFQAHSGSKYLFALFRDDSGVSDEWAISPELNGTAQTISFYAKSYSAQYPEKIKVSYSTGSTDPADFVVVKTFESLPAQWTRYEFDVPEGARYFAINSCARNAFMLMVDDVTYIPEGAPVTISFKGYDVYRDGVKINDTTVETCEYLDINVENGKKYEYVVVTVYNKGQSSPSNVASVLYQSAGIDSPDADGLTISGGRNSITIAGAVGLDVAVFAVDGKAIFSGQGGAVTVVPVQAGAYVVKAGAVVTKVIVK